MGYRAAARFLYLLGHNKLRLLLESTNLTKFPYCDRLVPSQNKYQCLSAVLGNKDGTFFAKDLLIKVKWKFQNIEFEKKGIRNQAAEQFKIERAAGQGGIWYRFRPVSVCLDKQLPRRNKYAGTC